MKVRTKLTLLATALIVLVVITACVMIFSFAKENALSTAFDSGVSDYERFRNALSGTQNNMAETNELTKLSFIKYAFSGTNGSWEYALQTDEGMISNNTGIDAYGFLQKNGKNTADHSEIRYGYLSMGGSSHLIIGGDVYLCGDNYHLSLVRDISKLYAGIGALAAKCIVFCVGLLAVAALCMMFVVKRTLAPLSVLQKGVKRVAAGKYDEFICMKSKDEFAELAAGYNEMAKAVDDRMKEIQKTSEDRKLLLSSLSHEMRTPVTAITAYAHSLSHVRMTDEQKREAVAFINDESLRLERLSSKLMQLISLNNRDALEFTSISSSRLMQTLTPVLAPAAEKKNIEIVYDAQTEAQYHIETDLMICLITNLFDNAVKAGAGRIVIGLNENEIFVSDNGCGIPEDKLAEITEPFYKLDQSRNTEGFGLGLALVKRIAEAHGAALVINSEVAKGTKISVKF